jgi:hypothetical protein
MSPQDKMSLMQCDEIQGSKTKKWNIILVLRYSKLHIEGKITT